MSSHDVQALLLDLAIILAVARLFGAVARALRQPAVVGEIVAGVALGPTLLGHTLDTRLFPASVDGALVSLADLGLIPFMFLLGYELDRQLIRGRERVAVSVSIGSIVLPAVLGVALGCWLAHRHHSTQPVVLALFVGAAMAVTAFPVLARILTDSGLERTRLGGLALASAALDDVVAWGLLAAVVAMAGAAAGTGGRLIFAPGYVAVLVFVLRPLLRLVVRKSGPTRLVVIVVGLVLSSLATEWLGMHLIFGAFAFGVALPRGGDLAADLVRYLQPVSVLLLPVYFVLAGRTVDLTGLGAGGLLELALVLAVAIGGKFLGTWVGAVAAGAERREASALAALMNSRGLTELVILTVGLQLRVLDGALYSLMVVMALLTTVMTGPLLRLARPHTEVPAVTAEPVPEAAAPR
ncbi:cation:proton antiporter [Actinocatenispora sera]|uniref:Cation/H+ exchanger transmembrane domain-containing protein n=1 Tax=Actinocatenispora sera TaxID=390989 RepID=A0A810KV10_9ACTN|nr:cation:proton antiporter [Actinocatenispora sera]BCJ25948.1 hypothetical protein Asera_00560 [Actinocatenispora sera]